MKESVRLMRFALIGTLNYLITMGIFWLMMAHLSFRGDYIVANIVAYLIAQTHNFVWCRYWIFPSEHHRIGLGRQIILFCTAFCMAYITQFLCLILMVEVLNMNEYVAQFIGIVVYGAMNFMANKKITFK